MEPVVGVFVKSKNASIEGLVWEMKWYSTFLRFREEGIAPPPDVDGDTLPISPKVV